MCYVKINFGLFFLMNNISFERTSTVSLHFSKDHRPRHKANQLSVQFANNTQHPSLHETYLMPREMEGSSKRPDTGLAAGICEDN